MRNNTMRTVVVRMVGGIGNQLFIYAAGRRLAKVNNARLVLDIHSGFIYDVNYKQKYQLENFNLGSDVILADRNSDLVLSRAYRFLFRKINRIMPFSIRKYISQEGRDFDSRILNLRFTGTIYLEGYWQSESYFFDIENQIREEFRIKEPKDIVNRQLGESISKVNAVAIHLRFFDIKNKMLVTEKENNNNFFYEYYSTAIKKLSSLSKDPHFYVFSDKPDLAKKFLEVLGINYTLIDHNKGDENAASDLWLMSLCKHFIIANSIFSWWGAWLCNNENKIVIAPGSFKGKELEAWGFKGLIPKNWIILNL